MTTAFVKCGTGLWEKRFSSSIVALRRGVPDEGIPPGAQAVIVHLHPGPDSGYGVEVVDDDGRTVRWGPVEPEDIEPASTGA
jgi:hypothetical protein